MTRWQGAWAAVGGVALAIAGIGPIKGRIEAQEPAPAAAPTTTASQTPAATPGPASKSVDATGRRRHDPARRVPAYFGQIGLTAEQRANIYSIQSKRLEAIESLEQQIAREKAEMIAQCEATLTDTQRKLLENLRRGAAENGTARAGAASPR